jgi:hypothetical protein
MEFTYPFFSGVVRETDNDANSYAQDKAEAEKVARLLHTHMPKLKLSTIRYADEYHTAHLYHTLWKLQMETTGYTTERAFALEAMTSNCKLCQGLKA